MDKINVDGIFDYWSNMYSFEEGSPEYLIDREDFKQAMKEFAEKILELAAENANSQCEYGQTDYCGDCDTHLVNKKSITSVINQIEF